MLLLYKRKFRLHVVTTLMLAVPVEIRARSCIYMLACKLQLHIKHES